MDCTYSYPEGHTVKTAFWTKSLPPDSSIDPPDLLNDPEYRDRVQYLGDKQHDCKLSLRDVREDDQRRYYFRFITDIPEGKYQGTNGVYLSVTGLQVEVSQKVIEGDKVTLTCKTTCRLTDRPSFTWFRNGAPFSSRTDPLHLQSVSREDAGRYSCAVLDLKLYSPEVTLNVFCKYKISYSCSNQNYAKNKNNQRRKVEEHDYQNADPNVQDDTYTALDPMSRSPDDVYETLAKVLFITKQPDIKANKHKQPTTINKAETKRITAPINTYGGNEAQLGAIINGKGYKLNTGEHNDKGRS
ncbi:uncharacterized protein LOC125785600 [Astyanax mexicanus]|uniref:uncharacterized protein LOC125785600 n=1 Tax=Astyanax mexicanus TaxID=7994 RepID=UPI0020CAF10E|nr:uncharacterized protein LOC125785600 [Astyanax mexicanus]